MDQENNKAQPQPQQAQAPRSLRNVTASLRRLLKHLTGEIGTGKFTPQKASLIVRCSELLLTAKYGVESIPQQVVISAQAYQRKTKEKKIDERLLETAFALENRKEEEN